MHRANGALTLPVFVMCTLGCGNGSFDPKLEQVIQLTAPGAEPRRAVAFHPATTAEAPVDLHFTRGPSGTQMTIKVVFTSEVPHPEEAWRMRFIVSSFALDGSELDGCYKALEGVMAVDVRGRAIAGLVGNCSTNPSVPALLTQLTVPLPAEAIGLGATWHAAVPGGRGMDYQLTSWTANGATITWGSAAGAPTKPNGEFGVITSGKSTIRFDDVLPVNATITTTSWTPFDTEADRPDRLSIER
jgi:hypothetical protein